MQMDRQRDRQTDKQILIITGLYFAPLSLRGGEITATRNAWQRLAYSPFGVTVSPHSE